MPDNAPQTHANAIFLFAALALFQSEQDFSPAGVNVMAVPASADAEMSNRTNATNPPLIISVAIFFAAK